MCAVASSYRSINLCAIFLYVGEDILFVSLVAPYCYIITTISSDKLTQIVS